MRAGSPEPATPPCGGASPEGSPSLASGLATSIPVQTSRDHCPRRSATPPWAGQLARVSIGWHPSPFNKGEGMNISTAFIGAVFVGSVIWALALYGLIKLVGAF